MTKNNTLATKRQRTTIQRPKDKEQQYSDQKTKNNNTTTKRQRTTIQRPKDKEQQYSDQKTTNNNTATKRHIVVLCMLVAVLLFFVFW
jgi:Flp pilus assembly protein TadB